MAETLATGTIQIVGDARQLRATIEDAKKSIRTLGEGQRDISRSASASIDRYIGQLQRQNATFGKSARETELYKLALRGASNEQINLANSILKVTEANEKQKAALSTLADDAKKFGKIIGTAIGTGIVAGVAAFELLLHKTAEFQDLADTIGDSSERLASFAVAAAAGGKSVSDLAQFSVSLSKTLANTDEDQTRLLPRLNRSVSRLRSSSSFDPQSNLKRWRRRSTSLQTLVAGKPLFLRR
jgi:uncharacterized protein YoxC